MSTDFLLFIVIILLALVIAHAVYAEMRIRKFMIGKNATSMEEIIHGIVQKHPEMIKTDETLTNAVAELRTLISGAARGISVVRFNAFAGDASGKQSSATAILSERGDGVVISSLHARENARMYAKPLSNFTSEYELTEEEKRAIIEARKNFGTTKK